MAGDVGDLESKDDIQHDPRRGYSLLCLGGLDAQLARSCLLPLLACLLARSLAC